MDGDGRAGRSLAMVFMLSWGLSSASYWLILGPVWGWISVVSNASVLAVFGMSCFAAWIIRSRCSFEFKRDNAK
jgi:hypothetical protein